MNSNIISNVRKAFFQMKMITGAAKARAKTEHERGCAEILLIQDDIRAEGIEPMSALGLACTVEIWKKRQLEIHREIHKDDDDPLNGGFPRGW
jgi:hypothetical protein